MSLAGIVRTGLEAIDASHMALRKNTSKTPEQKPLLISGQAENCPKAARHRCAYP